MSKLLIIADDLTGAIDSGVQLSKVGVSTLVLPELTNPDHIRGFEAVVVNTESRHLSPEDAAEAVRYAVQIGQQSGAAFYYKKTDSSLRGNLGAEFDGLLKATGHSRIMFIPAFPSMGRVTRFGKQYINGVALHNSEFHKDPLNPLGTADIGAIIHQQSNIKTHNVARSQLTLLDQNLEDGIYIFDSENDDDMREISDSLHRAGAVATIAGSAGFAERLTELLHLETFSAANTNFRELSKMLFVNGSLNPVAQRQVSAAAKSGFRVISVEVQWLLNQTDWHSEAVSNIANQIRAAIQSESCTVVTTSNPKRDDALPGCDTNLMLEVAERFGQFVARSLSDSRCRALTVIGGDTLSAITRALHCNRIVPRQELLPGIPLSTFLSSTAEFLVVSKAGGFGTDDVLPQLRDMIRRVQQ